MLFNSFPFIFAYLPVVLLGFFWIARRSHRVAILWLVAASLFFYGWWNPKFVLLLLASVAFNYGAGYLIGQVRASRKSKLLLTCSIIANLLLLGAFKYANFFVLAANRFGAHFSLFDFVLPLGISFFTFTQIAFLVDTHRGVAREYNFIDYLLFVTWFPHLIAGPVLHHKQMMPQFSLPSTYQLSADSIAVGLTMFSLGLFKKVVLADQFALYADPIFGAAAQGGHPMLLEAWIGALAYTMQLYFDFSGYSDMAIGLSRLFNIKLPINFNSPYKATNIIEFWRRWHMTLSTFLRDYLYIPLGGNRKGPARRQLNIMITMLLGGLWHGAGWNFVFWGGLHGLYLVINHGWRTLIGMKSRAGGALTRVSSLLITFAAVGIAWVPFRATNFEATINMLSGMAGISGVSLPLLLKNWVGDFFGSAVHFANGVGPVTGFATIEISAWLCLGLSIIWLLPNTQQWLVNFEPAWDSVKGSSRFAWQPTSRYAVIIGVIFGTGLLCLNRVSAFLYYQF
jgi:alginate O-acetyltransferase complex protein AlgI